MTRQPESVSWAAENRFMVRRGTCETLGTEKEGVERRPRLATERGVPSAVRTLTGESRGRREDNTEESEDMWKEAPESKTHEDVPDRVDACGGGEVAAVTAAAEPVDEDPEEARRRLSLTMSWSVSDGVEEDPGVPLEEESRWSRFFSR